MSADLLAAIGVAVAECTTPEETALAVLRMPEMEKMREAFNGLADHINAMWPDAGDRGRRHLWMLPSSVVDWVIDPTHYPPDESDEAA